MRDLRVLRDMRAVCGLRAARDMRPVGPYICQGRIQDLKLGVAQNGLEKFKSGGAF